MLEQRRYRRLAGGRGGTGPVVYWMSRDQRVRDNWALLFAQRLALAEKRPLMVLFCLTPDFPGANLRHYGFLVRGLAGLPGRLQAVNIGFSLLFGDPGKMVAPFIRKQKAAALVMDFDPLRVKRDWRKGLLEQISLPVHEVDAHNIVPCWLASAKQEYAAYTLRPKINGKLDEYLVPFPELEHHPHGQAPPPEEIDCEQILAGIPDRSVAEVDWLTPGEDGARMMLDQFIENRLAAYPENRNDPCLAGQSDLSPYLHFGQLAAQRVALAVRRAGAPAEAIEAFLEELIVRRELSDNFCHYNENYDTTAAFPKWAAKTLNEHRRDPREYLYTLAELEEGRTHEDLWNACQHDLATRGKLHGYLRMYWAKKILEWTASPEEALRYAIHLNDRYSLDGRDPNGYTGVAWSIGGVHDRAWAERPVFGKIRYMNLNGCRRKFDVDRYIETVRSRGR